MDVADSSFLYFYSLLFDSHDCLGEKKPGGSPRKGILGLDTTRGDRLFLSTDNGSLLVINVVSGKTVSVIKIDNKKILQPVIFNNNLFVARDNAIIKFN